MSEAKTMDAIVIELATSLNRFRALNETEVEWLERAIRREDGRTRTPGRHAVQLRWEDKDDRALIRLLKRQRKPRDIARAMGRSEQAVWTRIRQLRRAGKLVATVKGPMAQAAAVGG